MIAAFITRGFGLIAKADEGPLTLYGNVDIREVDLGFRVGGRINSIEVEEGAAVTAGQLLATLDRSSLESRARQADAQIAAAEANLTKLRNGNRAQEIEQARARYAASQIAVAEADRDYRRREPLVGPGAISRDIWDQTVATRDRARAQAAEARAALSLLQAGARREDVAAAAAQVDAAIAQRSGTQVDLTDTQLFSQTDGIVVTRVNEPGAIVQPGATILTLAINAPMRVRAYIGEPDLTRINPGMAVEVSVDGNPRTYNGTIGYISPQAEFTPKSVETQDLRTDLVYRLRIIVTNPDDALRQGQPVTVKIPTARATQAR
ncbi:HlyD family efflux transporter periplasmic adaptor subunit [Qipengyuania algicida]|uniref:HlyD family efflux transporter periplasmic adaptor subunit n=1 Tax=Qipengyuania algicida TaxID=1836209 RepID=UPI001F2756B6|nr:HlyD family efflux transporter periplasmic adaptor subunit [Qipengyuania algicida]